MTEPEIDKETGEAHDIHGAPKPGNERGAKIGDQGGDYYKKQEQDEEIDAVTDIKDNADLETNDEAEVDAPIDSKDVRTKGIDSDEQSDARTSSLASTNL